MKHFTVFQEGVPAAPILLALDGLDHLGQTVLWVEEELYFDARHARFKLGSLLHEVNGKLWLSPDRVKGTTRCDLVELGRELSSLEPALVFDEAVFVRQQVLVDFRGG